MHVFQISTTISGGTFAQTNSLKIGRRRFLPPSMGGQFDTKCILYVAVK